MRKYRRGFTLTEVMLVAAMFAVISLAVFNAFSNGFKLWARGEHVMVEGNIAIFLDRFAEDLRQTVIISGIPFTGNSEEIAFPAIVLAPADENSFRAKEGIIDQIGAIRYVFDPSQDKIFRYQAIYGPALKSEWTYPVDVADLIQDVTLRYYYKADRGLEEKTQADPEQGIPFGITIDVQYSVEGQEFHMRRFLTIPIGGGI